MNANFKVKNTSKKTVMNLLRKNLTSEMFHSIMNAIETPHASLKTFTFIFCLLANAFASYTTLTLILSYLNYGVTTTSRLILDTSVEFPKVTVCNINPFQTKYAYEVLNKLSKQANISVNLFDRNQLKTLDFKSKRDLFNGFKAFSIGLISSFSDMDKKRIGHKLEDILLSCRFNHKGLFWLLMIVISYRGKSVSIILTILLLNRPLNKDCEMYILFERGPL